MARKQNTQKANTYMRKGTVGSNSQVLLSQAPHTAFALVSFSIVVDLPFDEWLNVP